MGRPVPRTEEGRVSLVANGGTINGSYALPPAAALELFKADLKVLCERPTVDAYMRTCRALNWRTAQLRANGIEPGILRDDAPHEPPEDFKWPVRLDAATSEVDALRAGLHLFREFVLRNAAQWQPGAASTGHPIWAHIAELLGRTEDITSGPAYRFIQPDNTAPLADLQGAVDNRLCRICDGGPGNEGACLCGMEAWD